VANKLVALSLIRMFYILILVIYILREYLSNNIMTTNLHAGCDNRLVALRFPWLEWDFYFYFIFILINAHLGYVCFSL
jgi:hypothetical protein